MGRISRFRGSAFAIAAALLYAWGFGGPGTARGQTVLLPSGPAPAAAYSHSAVESCLVAGRQAKDFKLTDIVRGGMVTLLDASDRDYTFILFLDSRSGTCLDNLQMVERLRDRFREKVGLVTVFLDPTDEKELLRYLIYHQVYPDYALHDPECRQAGCYGIDQTPALLVVGSRGNVIFRASCDRPVEVGAFVARLENVLAAHPAGHSSFSEARRIYREAMAWREEGRPGMALLYLERILELQPNLYTVNCAVADIYRQLDMKEEAVRYYSRYLGADTYAYDLAEVRSKVRSLAGH